MRTLTAMAHCISCGPVTETDLTEDFRRHWREHPHYPDQLLLVRSHQSFRALSRELIARAEARRQGWRIEVTLLFRYWHQGMRGHEGYEEHKLYPYLARRYATDMAGLADDHEALHRLRDVVLETLGEGSDDEVVAALRRYDALLGEHLDREEATVIPLLLDLPPAEFDRYLNGRIESLLAELPPCEVSQNDGDGASR